MGAASVFWEEEMSEVTIGFVTPLVKLGGGKVSVSYIDAEGQTQTYIISSPTLGALRRFEEQFGTFEGAVAGDSKQRIPALINLLWILFNRYQKDLTEEHVGEMFNMADLMEDEDGEADGIAIQIINLAMTGKLAGGSPKVPASDSPVEAATPAPPEPTGL